MHRRVVNDNPVKCCMSEKELTLYTWPNDTNIIAALYAFITRWSVFIQYVCISTKWVCTIGESY